jgi:hypothetical protein
MRTVAAILAYLMAAMSGLAAGYYATAPRALPAAAVSAPDDRHLPHSGRGRPADLEAAAAFLAAEQRRADARTEPASADL